MLIVDDEADFRELIRHGLERRGFDVFGEETAESALDRLGAERFDVVLLDHFLPGVTGLAALPRIARRARAPVILVTGAADAEIHRDAIKQGARFYLRKPFELDALVKVVRGALD